MVCTLRLGLWAVEFNVGVVGMWGQMRMKWTKRAESRLRNKNRHGQSLSNQIWQDGDMETEIEHKEAMKAGRKPGKIPDSELNRRELRKRRSGVSLGKGGMEARKWTGLSHLFPHDSMQVVDFPHIGVAGVFWGSLKFDFQSQAEMNYSNWHVIMKACAWIRIGLERRERRTPGKSHGRCGKRSHRAQRCILVAIAEKTVQLSALKCG